MIVVLFTVLCCVMIVENLRAWRGYRQAQVRLAGVDSDGKNRIPAPKVLRASLEEMVMMLGMVTVAFGFCLFNPFTI